MDVLALLFVQKQMAIGDFNALLPLLIWMLGDRGRDKPVFQSEKDFRNLIDRNDFRTMNLFLFYRLKSAYPSCSEVDKDIRFLIPDTVLCLLVADFVVIIGFNRS